MTEHDEAILKAAESITHLWDAERQHLGPLYKALFDAVAAKLNALCWNF